MPDIYTDRNGFNWFGSECLNPDTPSDYNNPLLIEDLRILDYYFLKHKGWFFKVKLIKIDIELEEYTFEFKDDDLEKSICFSCSTNNKNLRIINRETLKKVLDSKTVGSGQFDYMYNNKPNKEETSKVQTTCYGLKKEGLIQFIRK